MNDEINSERKRFNIAVLPGDGIGVEVTAQAMKVLRLVARLTNIELSLAEYPIGGVAIDSTGDPFPPETEAACIEADAVFLGAVGGPQWDNRPREQSPEAGLLRLRRAMDAFANLRPVRLRPEYPVRTPLRPSVLAEGIDIMIIRELTGGLYYGKRGREATSRGVRAFDTMDYSESEIERIVRLGFELASQRGKRLTSVDKANVLESGRLWRETATKVAADYPDIELKHMYVDNCAMQLVRYPQQFDVIVTENTFGDILSDLGGALVGSLGVLPSASLSTPERPGLYEPVHGSAPDIAGQGISNPLAAIGSVAMMLRYSFQLPAAADAVDAAIDQVLLNGPWTGDIVPEGERPAGTEEVGDAVCRYIEAKLSGKKV